MQKKFSGSHNTFPYRGPIPLAPLCKLLIFKQLRIHIVRYSLEDAENRGYFFHVTNLLHFETFLSKCFISLDSPMKHFYKIVSSSHVNGSGNNINIFYKKFGIFKKTSYIAEDFKGSRTHSGGFNLTKL